jgi:hypothetical protein
MAALQPTHHGDHAAYGTVLQARLAAHSLFHGPYATPLAPCHSIHYWLEESYYRRHTLLLCHPGLHLPHDTWRGNPTVSLFRVLRLC